MRGYLTIQGICFLAVVQVSLYFSYLHLAFPHLEFIHLISSEASEISDREQRKTILPEHIIEALTVCALPPYASHFSHINLYMVYSFIFGPRRD